MGKILIKNGRVWDGEKFFAADVLTEEDRILKIAENLEDDADFTFDATGKIVSAGLVDLHAHLRGISVPEFGINAEMCCFPFGVTAVCDAGGSFGDRARLESFGVKSLVFAAIDLKDNRIRTENTDVQLTKYADRVAGVKLYFDTSSPDIQDDAPLREACRYAREKGLRLMVHTSNSPIPMAEIVRILSPGDIVTHAYHGGKNNCSDDEHVCFRLAREKGVVMDAGLAGHVHTDFKVFREAIAAGALPDTISSDVTKCSAYKRGGKYGLLMCMSIARTLGMSEEDVFRAVTSAPANVLGMEKEWGGLSVGRCADVAVLDWTDEPFDLTDRAGNRAHSSTGYRCLLTIADGEVVYRY